MQKIYLDGFFYTLSELPSTIFYDCTTLPNDCDIIGISFYTNEWHQHIETTKFLLPKTKKLLINLSEPTPQKHQLDFIKFLQFCDIDKVYTFSDAVLNVDRPKNFSTIVSWFIYPTNFYATESWAMDRIEQINHTYNKPQKVDCLLGKQRLHRNLIERFYAQSKFCNDIFFSYYKTDISQGMWDNDVNNYYLGQDPACESSKVSAHALLPVSIYNQTYYSVVAETTFENTYNQYTEKVAKPIIAKRPFIAFAGQHYLKNLKSLGFKTFEECIDESYDDVANLQKRMQLAWQQLELLCLEDPQTVYKKLQPVLDHNFQHFVSHDWHSAIRAHLK